MKQNSTISKKQEYGDEKIISEIFDIPLPTLRGDRFKRQGLPYIRLGRSIRYHIPTCHEFMQRRMIHPEKEAI